VCYFLPVVSTRKSTLLVKKGPEKVQIHPSAVIGPHAIIGKNVEIGPFCVVENGVEIGYGCRLEGRVTIKKGSVLGENNVVCEGTVIGGMPQLVTIPEACGNIVIGNGNVFRENTTVHRSMKESGTTLIGDNNTFMVNAHIAHDCKIGNNAVIVNNVLLAGHVCVEDRAILSGAVGVHQFCRVGTLAMVGGQAHVVQDVPPFMMVDGLTSRIVGLNLIGLRRAGYSVEEIKQLKAAYRMLYRSELPWQEILGTMKETFTTGPAQKLAQFLLGSTRGIVSERRSQGEKPILKIHNADEGDVPEAFSLKRNVG